MAENTLSSGLAERLQDVQAGPRPDLEFTRHTFGREPCYVVRNPITFQSHKFSTRDYHVLISLDEERPLGDVFDDLVAAGTLNQDQEEEFYAFVVNLHQRGLLNLPITDGKALYSRFRKRQVSQRKAKLAGFLFWRMPLVNPDAMLDRTVRYAAPLFSRWAVALWFVLMVLCAGIIWQRWGGFREPLHSILVTENLVGLWVLLVVLKVIHEFGHAYACKLFGGQVPEMGAFFICFTPCAYVDASASWGFASKRQRIAVSLGGMYVESIIGGIALLVWNATGPSLLNSFAHQTFLLASVVTIAFNANPLMRYDGYYILSDLVEIPNLRERSIGQVQAVCKRWLLGVRSPQPPFSLVGKCLLFLYGLGASAWRISLVVAICAGVALKVYIVGVAMAVAYALMVLKGAVTKVIRYLFFSPETAPCRVRAVTLGLICLLGGAVGIATIPVPMPVVIQGVVSAEQETPVYAQASGFLECSRITPGQTIDDGGILCVLRNAHTRANAAIARAELDMLKQQAETEVESDPAVAAMAGQRADYVRQRLRRAEQDVEHLTLAAPSAGRVVDCDAVSKTGGFIKKGEWVATIAQGDWIVQSLATAQQFADARPRTGQRVAVRLAGDPGRELSGTVTRVAAVGSKEISQASLTQLGGGPIAVAPDTMTARQSFFHVQIALDDESGVSMRRGMTARVSFRAEPETLGVRFYRSALRFVNKLRT